MVKKLAFVLFFLPILLLAQEAELKISLSDGIAIVLYPKDPVKFMLVCEEGENKANVRKILVTLDGDNGDIIISQVKRDPRTLREIELKVQKNKEVAEYQERVTRYKGNQQIFRYTIKKEVRINKPYIAPLYEVCGAVRQLYGGKSVFTLRTVDAASLIKVKPLLMCSIRDFYY